MIREHWRKWHNYQGVYWALGNHMEDHWGPLGIIGEARGHWMTIGDHKETVGGPLGEHWGQFDERWIRKNKVTRL